MPAVSPPSVSPLIALANAVLSLVKGTKVPLAGVTHAPLRV
jgi:hypothetical protein